MTFALVINLSEKFPFLIWPVHASIFFPEALHVIFGLNVFWVVLSLFQYIYLCYLCTLLFRYLNMISFWNPDETSKQCAALSSGPDTILYICVLKICSLLHQRYKDFSPSLVQGLLKVFFPGKSSDDTDGDRNMKAMKKRSTLKLLMELYYVGVIEDSSIFINIIKDLTSTEHLKDREATQTNLTLLASFARQGRVFLGLPLSGQDIHEEVHCS